MLQRTLGRDHYPTALSGILPVGRLILWAACNAARIGHGGEGHGDGIEIPNGDTPIYKYENFILRPENIIGTFWYHLGPSLQYI